MTVQQLILVTVNTGNFRWSMCRWCNMSFGKPLGRQRALRQPHIPKEEWLNGYSDYERGILVRFPSGQEIFHLLKASWPNLEPTYLPVLWVMRALFQGVKRPEHETDHCRGSEGVEVYLFSPFPSIACFLIKHRGMYSLLMNWQV